METCLIPDTPPETRRKYGILAVDDEVAVRSLLKVGLQRHGFTVWLAANSREALELYRDHGQAIDVVLMDVCMPGPDGPQTLAALRQLNPRIHCCFMSGNPGRYTAESLYNLGAAAVIGKPFPMAEVARVLGDLASRADQRLSGV